MITDIELSNFQGYKYGTIELSPGLNVITGESDTGKSSIIRLLTWIFANRPKGDGFRNHSMKKNDMVSGSVAFSDDGWVVREKGGKLNQYVISSMDSPLKALRTDVPTEVSAITKIDAVNIQSQHPSEQYFMLTDSPGQVAKHLNKVAGLTIMDDALSNINSSFRKNKQEAKFISEMLDGKKEDLKQLEWCIEASKQIDSLLRMEAHIEELNDVADELDNVVYDYGEMIHKLQGYKTVKPALVDIRKLEKVWEENQNNIALRKKIFNCVNAIKNVDEQLNSTLLLKNAAIEFYTLRSLILVHEKAKSKCVLLKNVIDIAKRIEIDMDFIEDGIDDATAELEQFAGKECPICGGVI